ncbi:MAG: galactokinase [Spirochaetes bacterium RBG_13_68_11]|nr:MAG: galactokinase [Spirochaetes bacterium RBG_13_68_11]
MDVVKQSHAEEYGRQPEVIASAPGRVNLIGEHTDYNEGYVFPMAIDFSIRVALSRRADGQLHFFSVDYKDRKRAALPILKYRKEDRWANYPKGIINELVERGHELGGMDLTIHGDVPQGAGLSSSAALEVATALAVQTAFGIEMGREELARLAQHAENEFVGVKCGIMDQFISRMAKEGHAMLLDARWLTYHFVPLSLKTARFVITNSRVPHGLVDSEYNRRREECRRCVDLLSLRKPGTALRDYTPDDLRDSMGEIPEATRKRCLHVVEENQRVLEAEEALRHHDLAAFGKLMNRSHESLRDLYEVSCPELDWLVKRAQETEGVYGSRLTGAGFGGCTVTLIEEEAIPRYREHITAYERIFGFRPEIYLCRPCGGARVLESRV